MRKSDRYYHGAVAFFAVLILSMPFVAWAMPPKEAQAADLVSCVPQNNKIVCTAAGSVVLVVPIPTIKVPGPTITLPGATVTVKPPVVTQTQTVTVPGGTETVTVEVPGDTVTETVTINPQPSELPTATVTETATTGQTDTPSGTVVPQPEQPEPDTRVETVIKTVGTGLLVSIVLAALGIFALLLGYRWGFADGETNQKRDWNKWVRSVLDR